jgi:hypothetical protein
MGHPSICCWGAFTQLCAHRMNQEAGGKSSGIPHLAKNERDVGHPSFVGERKVDPLPRRRTEAAQTCELFVMVFFPL